MVEERGSVDDLVPASPWPEPITLGSGRRLARSVVGGSLWGGSEGERGGLAAGLSERVLVVDLVVGLVVGTGAKA